MSEPEAPDAEDLGWRLRDVAKTQVAPADALGRLRDRLSANIPALGPAEPSPLASPGWWSVHRHLRLLRRQAGVRALRLVRERHAPALRPFHVQVSGVQIEAGGF